jgi:hypothetical protein
VPRVSQNVAKRRCFACGGVLPPLLFFTGSVRCQDCRDAKAPLRVELVEPAQLQAA